MDFLTIIFIAFGLSMDAFAVSITNGAVLKKVTKGDAFKIGVYFGGFQAFMPLLGWILGVKFQNYITEIDHWIAFLLLGFIGGKMIYETLKENKKGESQCEAYKSQESLSNKTLIILSIATSIDALAVGISFAFLKVSIIQSAILIGLITFIICFIGVLIGRKCGQFLKTKAEFLGGAVLILIGIKIFIEHTIM
ncbi:manganese efflux pump [Clostridium niameyense]|uniref:Putative manganese efflux pump MntP n=1 Tax=Clostridium niameyense TaxID=1622073 RepID=A0A6M0R8K6_9CLOT|nr:manganese efflux pump MntP family protein [Clostridium niameyense]NEZ46575.1 manganese efflux pump [Clostridium niameyense]